MEHLDGRDLAAALRDDGPLPLEQAVAFVLQACEAIAEAHGLGIIHRDLRPADLFGIRRPDGLSSIKVLDFGISKGTGRGGARSGPTWASRRRRRRWARRAPCRRSRSSRRGDLDGVRARAP
jgi:serine/threonine-protein kinase